MILCYLLRHHFVIPRLRSIGSDKEGAHALLHLMKSDMVGGLEYAHHGTGVGYFGAMPLVRQEKRNRLYMLVVPACHT
jgi:hypothetical protein